MKSEILNTEIPATIQHAALVGSPFGEESKTLQLMDKWIVIVNGESFDYYTGIGHRKACAGFSGKREFKDLNTRYNRAINTPDNIIGLTKCFNRDSRTVAPSIDDVLYALLSYAGAVHETFEDWADNFGYDEDSRKAMHTWEECRRNGKKILKALSGAGITSSLDELSELFQDY